MAVSVALNTPLAEELSNVVQPKLVEVGWTTGGLDDSALAEYIILMLVNGKTQEQIAAELSNDLLNLGPDDSGATDFSKWLFEQVNILSGGPGDATPSQVASYVQQPQTDSMPSYPGEEAPKAPRRGSGQSTSAGSPDTEMGETMEGIQDGKMYVYVSGRGGLSYIQANGCSVLQDRNQCGLGDDITTGDL